MAEVMLDLRVTDKVRAYSELERHIEVVLDDTRDVVAAMATMAAIIHHAFGHLWTGFYRVVEPGRLLRIGPYQGTLGCLEIEFGRGVCGLAAAQGKTVLVPDVATFPGHITCDSRSRSEIVVPVFDSHGRLMAVLDIDSIQPAAFDNEDHRGLELVVRWFARADAEPQEDGVPSPS